MSYGSHTCGRIADRSKLQSIVVDQIFEAKASVQTDPIIADLFGGIACAADRGDPDLLREHITRALAEKVLHALAAKPEFRQHVLRVSESAHRRDQETVWAVLAELGRLERYLRPSDHWPLKFAAPLLDCGFEPSPTYGSADQRLYIAQLIASSNGDVSLDGIARAAIHERTGEKVRSVLIRTLMTRQPLSAALAQMTMAIRTSSDKAALSADSWLRRLHRVLIAVDDELDAGRVELDGDLVQNLRQFVTIALSRSSTPRDYGVSSTTVAALFDFGRHLVQLRVRLGVDPRFYDALAGARAWFPDGGWLRFTRNSSTLRQFRRTLLDGLLLLLEQGKPDSDLLDVHLRLSPNRDAAKAELADLDTQSRHLSPNLRQWLRSSGRHQVVAKEPELAQSDDLAIAFLLIAASDIDQRTVVDVEALLRELDITAPTQARTLRQFAKDAVNLVDRVKTLAKRRRLNLFGTRGDIVEFSPHAFKLATGENVPRRVRVTSPGVEQLGTRTSRVLVHALVEPADAASLAD